MGVELIWTEDEIHKWGTAHYNPILRECNPVIRQWTTAMVHFDANSSESLDGLALNHEIDVRIFHEIEHPAIGVSLFMEPTLYRTSLFTSQKSMISCRIGWWTGCQPVSCEVVIAGKPPTNAAEAPEGPRKAEKLWEFLSSWSTSGKIHLFQWMITGGSP